MRSTVTRLTPDTEKADEETDHEETAVFADVEDDTAGHDSKDSQGNRLCLSEVVHIDERPILHNVCVVRGSACIRPPHRH